MTPKQTSFFLMLSAFIVALMITYFEFKREEFNQKCKTDSGCADGLKCVEGVCTKG